MSDEKCFPDTVLIKHSINFIGQQERYIYQYPLVMEYLKKKIEGRKVKTFLKEIGANKVVLYAMTEFMELMVEELANDEKIVYAVSDKIAERLVPQYSEMSIMDMERLLEEYKKHSFDKLVICSVFHRNEIIEELQKRGILLADMITIVQIINWM